MGNWEYKSMVLFNLPEDVSHKDYERSLDAGLGSLGNDGWELAICVGDEFTKSSTLIFKRPCFASEEDNDD